MNPTKAQVQIVIDNLMSVLPQAKSQSQLNMLEGRVNEGSHVCGTVHCHGGWYAIATLDLSKDVYYDQGSKRMAEDLGFNDSSELKGWADGNPGLWGNIWGLGIFSSEMAFSDPDKRNEGAKTLQHIIDHWTEVRDRLPS